MVARWYRAVSATLACYNMETPYILREVIELEGLKATKGNKISKIFPITPHLNLYSKFELRVIFCCRFWHRLEGELKIGGLFEILLPLNCNVKDF